MVAAIWKKVREGTVGAADAIAMTNDFKDHFRYQYRKREAVADVLEEAMNLAQQRALRGYDAVQLASAKSVDTQLKSAGLSALIFVSADDTLLAAAQAEGLMTENPNNHP